MALTEGGDRSGHTARADSAARADAVPVVGSGSHAELAQSLEDGMLEDELPAAPRGRSLR